MQHDTDPIPTYLLLVPGHRPSALLALAIAPPPVEAAANIDTQPRKRPLSTALGLVFLVTLIVIRPVTFQTRYTPFWKLASVWVSSKAPVPVSNSWIVWLREPSCQSRA